MAMYRSTSRCGEASGDKSCWVGWGGVWELGGNSNPGDLGLRSQEGLSAIFFASVPPIPQDFDATRPLPCMAYSGGIPFLLKWVGVGSHGLQQLQEEGPQAEAHPCRQAAEGQEGAQGQQPLACFQPIPTFLGLVGLHYKIYHWPKIRLVENYKHVL